MNKLHLRFKVVLLSLSHLLIGKFGSSENTLYRLQRSNKLYMSTITLEKSLLNEMIHIMGNEVLMAQTIKFVRSIV